VTTSARGPIWLVDVPGMRLLDLRARARSLVERRGVELLVVDYLQLVQGIRERGDNRVQEVASISLGLKNLARECKVPVVAVAALRRPAWGTKEPRPTLESLRESGSQEQDADVVLLLHREMAAETAELIIAKQRNGPTGVVPLIWQRECVRFQSAAGTDGRDG
jgi:replicative DNA helicase